MPRPKTKDKTIALRAKHLNLSTWRRHARASGMNLSEWITHVLNDAGPVRVSVTVER